MYEKFYGFRARPFSKTPDPKFMFMSRTHEEALARLQYAVEEREIVVLTGGVGCGKTMLTRALMDALDEKYKVVLILNPRLTSCDFLKTICGRLQCNAASGSKSDLLEALYSRLYEDHMSGVTPVVIIDEAHLIPYRETFEEIRLLTNYQLDDVNLLSLVLVGQPELRKKLELPELSAFRQRIGFFYHLGSLCQDEIRSYIEHRIAVSGRDEPLFTDGAMLSMYRYSKGIPRVINNLASMSLLEGFGRDARIIDESIVASAAKEIGLNGHCENKKEI